MKEDITVEEGKPAHNNVYDGHAQQKLVTPHIRDRCVSLKKRKMSLEIEIYQIISQRLLDEFDSIKMVKWAVDKLNSKYNSESLQILAGLDLESTEERENYFWNSVKELGFDIKEETSDLSYGKYIAKLVLNNELSSDQGLKEMTKIYNSNKSKNKMKFFHFNEIDLELSCMEHIGLPIGVKPKIPFGNMDDFLKKEFELFLKNDELGIEREYKENEFHYNWDKLLSSNRKSLIPPQTNMIIRFTDWIQSVFSIRK